MNQFPAGLPHLSHDTHSLHLPPQSMALFGFISSTHPHLHSPSHKWYILHLYHSAWAYERRRHSAQIPCTEAEPLKPGYMRVARLLRFLLITVKLIIYKNIFKAELKIQHNTTQFYIASWYKHRVRTVQGDQHHLH